MADKQRLIDLQNKVVHCLARAMNRAWDILVVNFEREVIDGERTLDTLAIAFSKEKRGWTRISVSAPYECCELLFQLSELMSMDGNRVWGSCTVEIDASGKYRYSFCYDPPKRLNGAFDDDAMLKTFTPGPL